MTRQIISWLLVGVGDIAVRRVIPAIQSEPRSRLIGAVTRAPEKAASLGVPLWTDFDTALRECAADAVYIATPVFLHAPQTIAAMHAGRDVICEKPMALNYAESCAMNAAAAETGRALGIAYYRRNFPKVLRARQLLEQGAIGRPVLAEGTCHGWFEAADGRTWLQDPKMAGGGPLFDIASHRIDVMNFLFGEPRRVTAQISNVVHQTAVEDCATVLVEYSSGVRGIVDVRWHSRVNRDEFRIVGTDGELNLTPLSGPRFAAPGGIEELPTHANVHYPLIENFVSHLVDGTPLSSTGETAVWTDWVSAQALRADRALYT